MLNSREPEVIRDLFSRWNGSGRLEMRMVSVLQPAREVLRNGHRPEVGKSVSPHTDSVFCHVQYIRAAITFPISVLIRSVSQACRAHKSGCLNSLSESDTHREHNAKANHRSLSQSTGPRYTKQMMKENSTVRI